MGWNESPYVDAPDDCRELIDIYTELDAPDKSSVLGYARGVYAGEKYKKGDGDEL